MQGSDTITISDFSVLLRRARNAIVTGALLGILSGIVLLVVVRPTYRAQVVVMPVSTSQANGSLNGILNQIGGLASIAGVGVADAHQEQYLAVLKSRQLAEKFVTKQNLFQAMQQSRFKFRAPPTASLPAKKADVIDAITRFKEDVLNISDDRRAGTTTVSIDWFDPSVASVWTNEYVKLANEELRGRAIVDAEGVLTYLQTEVGKVASMEVKETLYKLIESQLNTLSLAQARREYAFQVVDVATEPDVRRPVSPRLSVVTIGGTLLGAVFGMVFHQARRRRTLDSTA